MSEFPRLIYTKIANYRKISKRVMSSILGRLVFYGILTHVGYLIPNPVIYMYIYVCVRERFVSE